MANKELINLSNLQRFLSKLNEKFALKKAMKGISEDAEGNIIIGEEGLVPAPNENSKGKFLRSDGEWALPSETTVYDSMTIEEGIKGVSKVDRVINAKNLKQIVNSDGFLTSLDSSKLTGIINIENLPQGALERILIVSSKEERLTLLDTEVQLGDVVKEADTGLMYYVINTEKLNSEEGYTQFTAGSASSVPWSGVTGKPTIPTKTSDLTNDSDFAIDNDCVHKTGDETINGTKTFTVAPVSSNSATTNGYFIKLNAVARNEVPTQLYHATFRANDKNNKILGEYCIEKSTTGCTLLNMNVRSEDSNGNQLYESLYLNMSNDGSTVRFYPSSNNKVDLGMSSNKWAKVYSDDVVHTSGDETISGSKNFTNQLVLGGGGTSYGVISAKDTNSILRLFGGTSAGTGANLDLYGENLSSGGFSLRARTSDKIIGLDGKTDGTLKWNGKNVALDENLVHRSGNETIGGTKTFSSKIVGNLQGNADTATSSIKATQDSVGQQINKTYIKELSVSGRTITYKRGDNTTGTITTQDTNTTYSVATTSANGLMSSSDKSKLDGIASGANKYSLPTAGTNALGGVKTSSTVTSTSGLTACPIISGIPYYKDTNTTYSKLSQFTNDSGFITSSGSCNYATTAGSADNGVDSYGDSWIRFKNGIQMCWGSGTHDERISYPKAFNSRPKLSCTSTIFEEESLVVNIWDNTNTQFSCVFWNIHTNDWQPNGTFDWIAIGTWK